jgi:hypothetical protein
MHSVVDCDSPSVQQMDCDRARWANSHAAAIDLSASNPTTAPMLAVRGSLVPSRRPRIAKGGRIPLPPTRTRLSELDLSFAHAAYEAIAFGGVGTIQSCATGTDENRPEPL